jgi:hypothetical protein
MPSHHHHHHQHRHRNSSHSHSETIICNGKIANTWKCCLFYSRSYTITIDQIYLSLDLIHGIHTCSFAFYYYQEDHFTHIDDILVPISSKVIIYDIP